MARQIAQTCPCRAVAPPSGGTQRDFGEKHSTVQSSKKLGTAPSGGAPGTIANPLARAKRRAWKRAGPSSRRQVVQNVKKQPPILP